VHHLRAHRFLFVGRARPVVPLLVWDDGDGLPRVLDRSTVIVCGPGAAAGCGHLLGGRVVIPPGATGTVGSDLAAKAAAARAAIAGGARRVVVHVGAPDEAAHDRSFAAKVAALEAIDRHLVGPLAAVARGAGGRIAVCPDHGADPGTGRHDRAPVPAVVAGTGVTPSGPDRLTERGVASLPALPPEVLQERCQAPSLQEAVA
jgi:2,3-bisphosphoglycerate-independent phosphoglycerate mutase